MFQFAGFLPEFNHLKTGLSAPDHLIHVCFNEFNNLIELFFHLKQFQTVPSF